MHNITSNGIVIFENAYNPIPMFFYCHEIAAHRKCSGRERENSVPKLFKS